MTTSIKWLGHATFFVTTPAGKRIMIDPWLSNNPVCPLDAADVKTADIILVSHDHVDHSADALQIAQSTGAVVISQPEVSARFRIDQGLPQSQLLNGTGMNIGGSAVVQGITVTMVPAVHSTPNGAPCGFVLLLEDGTTLYHTGDTALFGGMSLIGELYPIDLVMLPIGSFYTMDPIQAAKAVSLLKPKKVIPMHYKTFPVLERSADRFVELVRKQAPEVKVVVLEVGQECQW